MTDLKSASIASDRQIMLALIAKDWRLYRLPILALVAVALGCYPITLMAVLLPPSSADVPYVFFNTAMLVCEITALLAAVFGGVAIAGERADHTANFLGVLPVSRTQIIFSKWIVTIMALGTFLGLNLLAAFFFWHGEPFGDRPSLALPMWQQRPFGPGWDLAAYWASASLFGLGCLLCFFGVGWLLSTFARSGPICACTSIAITTATVAAAKIAMGGQPPSNAWEQAWRVALPPLAVGLASLFAGTIYYLRRVAP